MADIPYPYPWHFVYKAAGNGGRGSFSYADTTVFGTRGVRVPVSVPIYDFLDYRNGSFPGAYIPGGGGGARAFQTINKGSRAIAFDPNGGVLIRLTAVIA